jgi:hypothetical protein
VAWASENAFEALEVAGWPDLGDGLRVAHRTLRPLLAA